MYPDGDAKLAGTSSEAHNIFDARYCRYCPKLDAVAYYNMVNGISIKKFAGQKGYEGGVSAFLFCDRDNRCLEVLWKDKGRRRHQAAHARRGQGHAHRDRRPADRIGRSRQGVDVDRHRGSRVRLYAGGAGQLPDRLESPAVRIASLPEGLIKGVASKLAVSLSGGLREQDVELAGPPTWSIRRATSPRGGSEEALFSIAVPENSNAREGDLLVKFHGMPGQLHARVPVTGRVAVRLLPVAAADGQPPAVRLLIRNYFAGKQDVAWRLALTGEIGVSNGEFGGFTPTNAYFADAAEGAKTIDGKSTADIVVPLSGVDPLTVYRIKASVSDASGRTVVSERPVAGFAAVPRATSPIKLDGSMAEADWKRAPCSASTRPASTSPTIGRRRNGRASRTCRPRCNSCGTKSTCTLA